MADYGSMGGGRSLRDALMGPMAGQGQYGGMFPPASGADQPGAAVPIPPPQPPMPPQMPPGMMGMPQQGMPAQGMPPQPDMGAPPSGFARPRLAPGLDYAGQLGLQR